MHVALGALVASPTNANVMDRSKYVALVESIKKLGFIIPIVIQAIDGSVSSYLIVDGHHRVKAAHELSMTDVPAIVLDGSEDARLVALAVNRLRGETDLAVAALIITELVESGMEPIDLEITGFSQRELQELMSAASSLDDVELEDMDGVEVPEEVGARVARPFLLDLTFRSKEDLAAARKALRKAAGKGAELSEGLLRIIRAEA